MFKSIDVAYWKSFHFNKISLILGIGCGLHFNCLFIFIKSLRKRTWFDLGLGCAKGGAPHSESLAHVSTPNRTKISTYFFNISSCTFGTVYGLENIGFSPSLNSMSTGSIFQVPIFPQSNSLIIYQFITLYFC